MFLSDGFFGDTFDLNRDGKLDEFERFMDFSMFMDLEEEREKRERAAGESDDDDFDFE